jgi:hypothetical protein
LRCGGSVWAGIVMKHHNTPTKHATSLASFCVHPWASSAPAWTQFPKTKFIRHNFVKNWPWNLWKMQGQWRNGAPNLHTDGRPLRGSSCIFSRPWLKCLTRLLTIESLMACSPYTSQSWRWMSAGFMFLASKKRITARISHATGFSVFLNLLNTQDNAQTWFDCLQIASVPSKRNNKLCTHAHHRDRSLAVAIFANGTYFVDTPRIICHFYGRSEETHK